MHSADGNDENEESSGPQRLRDSFFDIISSHYDDPLHLCLKRNHDQPAYQELRKKYFIPEVCRYDQTCYIQAATIYETMKKDDHHQDEERLVTFASENEKRLAFQLVFQSLKFESFLIRMLEKSRFFEKYPELIDYKPRVLMIVCDYIERRFQKRTGNFPGNDDVTRIEECILNHKTKLNASLARCRISSNFLSLDSFLPETVRENDKIASQMFLSCWVNQFIVSIEDMKNILNEEGFLEVESESELSGKAFMMDRHCYDLVFFPNEQLKYLDEIHFMKMKLMVMQDKSGCLAQHCMKYLTGEADDILFVNVGAAISLGHLTSLLRGNRSTFYAVGVSTNKQLRQCEINLETLGIDEGQVKLINGLVTEIDTNVEPYQNIKLIIMMASCTRNGVVNPSHFIVSEGEDYNFQTCEFAFVHSDSRMLHNLASGMIGGERVNNSKEFNLKAVQHCLQFSKLQTLVYCTRSLNEEEDEEVIKEAVDHYNNSNPTRIPYSTAPPCIPLHEDDIWNNSPLQGKFLRFIPSNTSSGCFIACINREAEDPQEMVREILAKAAARGIPVDVKKNKDG